MKLINFEEYIIRFFDQGSWKTFFRLTSGQKNYQYEVIYQLLKNHQTSSSIYVISMEGIDYMSTTATHTLVSASLDFSRQNQIPVVFTQAEGEVLEGLRSAPSTSVEDRHLWVVDANGNEEVLGYIPDRLREIIAFVKQKQLICASEIPELRGEEINKKTIGNASVYLQDMFNMGLLLREKVSGSNRNNGVRGWTYVYRLPCADIDKNCHMANSRKSLKV